MTDDQKKLVEDNHLLIYKVINDMKLSTECNYGLAAIGLCKAAINYNPEKCSFSTFAYKCIKNEIMCDYRSRNKPKRALNENLISYDVPILSQDGGEKISLLDQIESDVSVEDEAICAVLYNKMLEQLEERDRKILLLFQKGLKQADIAKIIGISQANVSKTKRKIKNMLCCG